MQQQKTTICRRKAETPIEETKPVVESKRGIRRRAIAEDEETAMEAKLKIAEKFSKRPEAAKRSESIVNLYVFHFYSVFSSL